MVRKATPIAVYLESGKQRVFASALDWPGWCRAGKDEKLALETLAAHAPRYALVTREARLDFAADHLAFDVVERIPGSATTDFGAPGEVASSDHRPLKQAEARRLTALVQAAWTIFDRAAATAPSELRKGPRGGGRDRDKMVEHVLSAEAAYARKLGIRLKEPAPGDRAAVKALRTAIVDALQSAWPAKSAVAKGWPPRYAARRIAWHVLDHAWEMQDRSTPSAGTSATRSKG